MSRFFDIDSPVMRFLTRVADLMILNILMIICCIPIVTIGAAFTGLHYVLIRFVRNEDGYVVKGFFKSFKENFKQATIIWLIALVFIGIFVGDWLIFQYGSIEFPKALVILLLALFMTVCMVICYVFPVLSRFENTVFNTIKNSLFMAILSFPKTILMMVLYAAPIALLYFVPMSVPLVFMFGFSAPAYVAAMLYSGTFKKFEPKDEVVSDEEFRIENSDSVTENRGDENEGRTD